jgi:hypothetical protein
MVSKLIKLKRRYLNWSSSNVQHILYSGMLESMTIYKTYCSIVRRPKLTFTLHCFMMSKLIKLKRRYLNWSSLIVQHILYSGIPESSTIYKTYCCIVGRPTLTYKIEKKIFESIQFKCSTHSLFRDAGIIAIGHFVWSILGVIFVFSLVTIA